MESNDKPDFSLNRENEICYRIKECRMYFEANHPFDKHFAYCLNGLIWRFEAMLKDMRQFKAQNGIEE